MVVGRKEASRMFELNLFHHDGFSLNQFEPIGDERFDQLFHIGQVGTLAPKVDGNPPKVDGNPPKVDGYPPKVVGQLIGEFIQLVGNPPKVDGNPPKVVGQLIGEFIQLVGKDFSAQTGFMVLHMVLNIGLTGAVQDILTCEAKRS